MALAVQQLTEALADISPDLHRQHPADDQEDNDDGTDCESLHAAHCAHLLRQVACLIGRGFHYRR